MASPGSVALCVLPGLLAFAPFALASCGGGVPPAARVPAPPPDTKATRALAAVSLEGCGVARPGILLVVFSADGGVSRVEVIRGGYRDAVVSCIARRYFDVRVDPFVEGAGQSLEWPIDPAGPTMLAPVASATASASASPVASPMPAASSTSSSSVATASEEPPAAPKPADVRVGKPYWTWYGYQTGAIDGLSIAFTRATWGWPVSVGLYLLNAPVIHAIHGRPAAAIASAGLRLVVPLAVGALYMAARTKTTSESDIVDPFVNGLLVGAVIVMGFDFLVLGFDKVEPRAPAISFAPMAGRDRAGVSFAMAF